MTFFAAQNHSKIPCNRDMRDELLARAGAHQGNEDDIKNESDSFSSTTSWSSSARDVASLTPSFFKTSTVVPACLTSLGPPGNDNHLRKTDEKIGHSKIKCVSNGDQEDNDISQNHEICNSQEMHRLHQADLTLSEIVEIDHFICAAQDSYTAFHESMASPLRQSRSIDCNSNAQRLEDILPTEHMGVPSFHDFDVLETIGLMQREQSLLPSAPQQGQHGLSMKEDEPNKEAPFHLWYHLIIPCMLLLALVLKPRSVSSNNVFHLNDVGNDDILSQAFHDYRVNEDDLTHDISSIVLLQEFLCHHDRDIMIIGDEACTANSLNIPDRSPLIGTAIPDSEILMTELDEQFILSSLSQASDETWCAYRVRLFSVTAMSLVNLATTFLNMIILVAIAVIYVCMPRQCLNPRNNFKRMTISFQSEFANRGSTPSSCGIHRDMIGHLCDENDKCCSLTKAELQRELKALGASISGNKKDLQHRLQRCREAL